MKLKDFIFVQFTVLIFSAGSIFSKYASYEPFLSFRYILFMGLEVFTLGVYAILYQQILKRMSLTTAYAHKGTTILWSMLLGYLFFHETVTLTNFIGAVVVMAGIIYMSIGGEANE